MTKSLLIRTSAAALIVAAVTTLGASVFAASGGFECPDVYSPVICSNGKIYPNACYAAKAKAKNCVPYGDV